VLPDQDVVEIYTLWNRLKKRFSLVKSQPHSFTLRDTVQPITNVDFVLARLVTSNTGKGYSEYGCEYVVTVPTGKRWILHVMAVDLSDGANCDQFIIEAGGVGLPIHEFAAANKELLYLPHPLPLYEGNRIGVRIALPDAPGIISMDLIYEEVELEE